MEISYDLIYRCSNIAWLSERERETLMKSCLMNVNDRTSRGVDSIVDELCRRISRARFKISRERNSELHKGYLPSTGYIHPKWAFPPTGPSLSQTIDNRPVLSLPFEQPSSILERQRRSTKSSKFIVPSNCSNHSGVRALGGTAKCPKMSWNLTNFRNFPSTVLSKVS